MTTGKVQKNLIGSARNVRHFLPVDFNKSMFRSESRHVPYGKALRLKRLFAVYAMRTIVLRAVILAETCCGRFRFFGIHTHLHIERVTICDWLSN